MPAPGKVRDRGLCCRSAGRWCYSVNVGSDPCRRCLSYCQMSWMEPEVQAASLTPSLKITPAITSGSNALPLSFRQ